jgi:dipeptidyl aminopeptidase/acylaminoacyl peptidase
MPARTDSATPPRRARGRLALVGAVALALWVPGSGSAQQGQQQQDRQRAQQERLRLLREAAARDPDRAAQLYVSDRLEDHSTGRDFERDIASKARTDSIFAAVTDGVVDYRKVTYRSRIGDLDIPAYVFQPTTKRGPRGHAAILFVHGGVHGNWTPNYWPFVKEAVERGYVIIAPDYRGSTGYGKAFHDAIDYGGHEVDDVVTAYDYIVENLPHVDPERVAIMGWSHGGYISLLAAARDSHPFQATVGIVPVTNLFQRLSYKGPGYQRGFSTQARIGGLPFEQQDIYKERSPFYQVQKIQIPILVHVATNDDDVNYEEAEMLIHKLRAVKPDLAETKVYVDPPSGHSFSRRVNNETLERMDTPEMRDSWNRTWTFLEWVLRPYFDPNAPAAATSGG